MAEQQRPATASIYTDMPSEKITHIIYVTSQKQAGVYEDKQTKRN